MRSLVRLLHCRFAIAEASDRVGRVLCKYNNNGFQMKPKYRIAELGATDADAKETESQMFELFSGSKQLLTLLLRQQSDSR